MILSNCMMAKNFDQFAPTLQECVDTAMAIAEAKQGSKDNLYDFMLDEFEIGMSQERIDGIFKQIEDALVPFIEKVLNSQTPPSKKPLQGTFGIEEQKALSERLVKSIGFNVDNGRFDGEYQCQRFFVR